METQNNLVKIITDSGLEKAKSDILIEKFADYYEIAAEWKQKADELVITDVSQKNEMKLAREGRLFLKDKRVCIEKTRKFLKEASLKEGQTIDSIAKELTNLIEPIEKSLEEKEKYIEIQEANRKAELKAKREAELLPYKEFVPMFVDISSMSDDDFTKLLNGSKLQLQAKIDAEAKAEAERIENERKQKLHIERKESVIHLWQFASEFEKTLNFGEQSDNDFNNFVERLKKSKSDYDAKQEEVRLEYERLKAEKEAKEALNKKRNEELRSLIIFIRDYDQMLNLPENEYQNELKAIRIGAQQYYELEAQKKADLLKQQQENEAKLKAEKERNLKLQAELKAKQDAEEAEKQRLEKEEADRKKAEIKASKAPKKQKLNTWIDGFILGTPIGLNDDKTVLEILEKFEGFKKWAKSEIENM